MFLAGLSIAGAGGVGAGGGSFISDTDLDTFARTEQGLDDDTFRIGIGGVGESVTIKENLVDAGRVNMGLGTITPGVTNESVSVSGVNLHVQNTAGLATFILEGDFPVFDFIDTAGAADDKFWQMIVDGGLFTMRSILDNGSVRTNNIFVADLGTGAIGIGQAPVAGSKLSLPLEAEAVTPTLSFGDGDTGLFERVDDILAWSFAGVSRMEFSRLGNGSVIDNTNGNGGILLRGGNRGTGGVLNVSGDIGVEIPRRVDVTKGAFWVSSGLGVVFGEGEGGVVAATGDNFRAPDVATGGAGNVAGADSTWAAGLGTGTGTRGSAIIQVPIVATAGDNLQTRIEAVRVRENPNASGAPVVGIGTAAPFENVAGGTTDLGGVGLHIKSTGSGGNILLEGGTGAAINFADLGGAANDKVGNLIVDAGVIKFRSLNDNITTRVDNILNMDMGTGQVQFGTASGPTLADAGADVVISGSLNFRDVSSEGSTIWSATSGDSIAAHIQMKYNGVNGWSLETFQSGGGGDSQSLNVSAAANASNRGARLTLLGENQLSGTWLLQAAQRSGDFGTSDNPCVLRGANADTDNVTFRDGGGIDIIGGAASTTAGTGDGGDIDINGGAGAPSGNRGAVNIAGIGTGLLSFFAATAAVQVTDIVALTDSTGGTANNTLVAISGSGADAAINDNFADLAAKVNALRDFARTHGLMA